MADPAAVADAWAGGRAEVAFADRLLAGAVGLDVVGQGGEEPLELREVLVRMIEEYGRPPQRSRPLSTGTDCRAGGR